MELIEVRTPRCIHCGDYGTVVVTKAGFESYRKGAYIQDAFPYLPAPLREQILNGTHPDCFTEMFADCD
ncbi:MAG: hypothetical protein EB075_12410 [Bacteroidetes bacterium]|nr:hypothetical protein [Bacteroidota bacterium]